MSRGPGPYDPQPHPPHPNPNSAPPGQPPMEVTVLPPHVAPSTDSDRSASGPEDPNTDPDPLPFASA
jgi:hypothetical protein